MRVGSGAVLVAVSLFAISCAEQFAPPAKRDAASKPAPIGAANARPEAIDARKIVYEATMELAVTDLSAAADRVEQKVAEIGGYIASSDRSGRAASAGETRIGRFTLRVPVAAFRATLDVLRTLGTVDELTTTTQDKSSEWTDLDARIGAKRVEEKRLLRAVDDRAGTLEEVLKVEAQLARVRGEIESMQGALASLAKLVELSTITLTLIESRPLLPSGAPAFLQRLGSTFVGSATALLDAVEVGAIVLSALLPWMVALLAGVIALRYTGAFVWRRLFRR